VEEGGLTAPHAPVNERERNPFVYCDWRWALDRTYDRLSADAGPIPKEEEAEMISYIHSTTIVVSDQSAALDFYVNVLGWEKAMDNPMGPEMRWLTVVPPGAQTQLVLAHPGWYESEVIPGKSTGISLVTPNIEATYETLKERGVKFKQPVTDMPWGAKATWFYDLDGNEFFLVGG
jgi:predicted enzyme related to lactoylglutathione lyase